MKILTIANRKGGAGKSTCAAHVSLKAMENGFKVVLIDMDPQKTLEKWWKLRTDEEPQLADATAENLNKVVTSLRKLNFDLCIIDTPGDTSANAISGIDISDIVLIPSKPTSPDFTSIGRTISTVKERGKEFFFLLTQNIPTSNHALQASGVLSEFGPVCPSVISNRVSYATAMSKGISAGSIDKPAQIELDEIWDYISSKVFNHQSTENKRKVI